MTNLEDIKSLKPESIFNVVPKEIFIERGIPEHDEYLKFGNYYEWYYAIAKYYQPKSYLEIGIRFGYSLGTILKAVPKIERVLCWDNESYIPNTIGIAKNLINDNITINKKTTIDILHINSQEIKDPPNEHFDLIHIDGDHSKKGVIHDLNLLKNSCTVCIIDDYDHVPDVRKGIDEFMKNNNNIIKNSFYVPTTRGMMLIEY